MLRIQINASRRPREHPGRSENEFQEKLRFSARMLGGVLRTVPIGGLFYTVGC